MEKCQRICKLVVLKPGVILTIRNVMNGFDFLAKTPFKNSLATLHGKRSHLSVLQTLYAFIGHANIAINCGSDMAKLDERNSLL